MCMRACMHACVCVCERDHILSAVLSLPVCCVEVITASIENKTKRNRKLLNLKNKIKLVTYFFFKRTKLYTQVHQDEH